MKTVLPTKSNGANQSDVDLECSSSLMLQMFVSMSSHILSLPSLPLFLLFCSFQIRFLLVQNRQGKTRLAKYYMPFQEEEKRQLQNEISKILKARSSKWSNFVEYRNYKIVYRRYAGLYFALCVDSSDNELAFYEIIHFFVEVLDQFFGNVCELDLVFNFFKVYQILDEIILTGEVQETSQLKILQRMDWLDKQEAKEK
eukprot:TRINITY_DN3193_c0_g1_i1.p1 TRINITY_DN3193_c0_g1~~TRINITY_DN3193_c0_g1_i1.p1  ORF type:complete len:199 (-),score=32.08 TRINITY_DN3193_c0_g1_i1:191-787(-)